MRMRSSSPLISIHLINYNCQPFLKQAVESALQQSLTDFELIIADDGSQDESQNLIKS
ncbi:glycosyltransferase, partial [bacterium]|nr:glycosyltransferase [bacterium]